MLKHAKLEWWAFKHSPAGRRFSMFYEKHRHRGVGWGKVVIGLLIFVSTIIGIILAFIPGPAILFFAISLALLATQSRWLARRLDGLELWVRRRVGAYRRRRQRERRA